MKALFLVVCLTLLTSNAYAKKTKGNIFDELDPRSPDIEKLLKNIDEDYEKTTGKSAHLEIDPLEELLPSCYRNSCRIWADIDKSAQRLYLYIDGALTYILNAVEFSCRT